MRASSTLEVAFLTLEGAIKSPIAALHTLFWGVRVRSTFEYNWFDNRRSESLFHLDAVKLTLLTCLKRWQISLLAPFFTAKHSTLLCVLLAFRKIWKCAAKNWRGSRTGARNCARNPSWNSLARIYSTSSTAAASQIELWRISSVHFVKNINCMNWV